MTWDQQAEYSLLICWAAWTQLSKSLQLVFKISRSTVAAYVAGATKQKQNGRRILHTHAKRVRKEWGKIFLPLSKLHVLPTCIARATLFVPPFSSAYDSANILFLMNCTCRCSHVPGIECAAQDTHLHRGRWPFLCELWRSSVVPLHVTWVPSLQI